MGRDNLTGAWSEGTLLSKDVIPASLMALGEMLSWQESHDGDPEEIEKAKREIEQIEKRKAMPGYYDSEDASFDLEQLNTLLNEFAPDGYYWGAHPGDGASLGFWKHEDS